MGRGKDEAHRSQLEMARRDGVVQFDFCFYGFVKFQVVLLVAVDCDTGCVFACMCRSKCGKDPYVVKAASAFIDGLGMKCVTLQGGGEPAAVDLANSQL